MYVYVHILILIYVTYLFMHLYAGGGQGQRISIKDRRYTNHDANCAEAWPVFRCPDMSGHVADSLRVRVSVDMCDEDPCKRFGVY